MKQGADGIDRLVRRDGELADGPVRRRHGRDPTVRPGNDVRGLRSFEPQARGKRLSLFFELGHPLSKLRSLIAWWGGCVSRTLPHGPPGPPFFAFAIAS